jgi:aquaporin Z
MKYIYELIGTFFLVFTVGMTVLEPNSAGIMAPLAIGSALAVMVFAGAHVSGGHYNPAVSFAVFLRGKLSLKEMGRYWAVQWIGAVLAGYLTIYLKGAPAQSAITIDTMRAFLSEFLFTFALCYVVLNVAIAKGTKGNSFYGWAIGFTVLVGAYSVGAVSGAAFNPAVALGITIMQFNLWSNLWIFFAANFLGGLCAASVFKAVDKKA